MGKIIDIRPLLPSAEEVMYDQGSDQLFYWNGSDLISLEQGCPCVEEAGEGLILAKSSAS